MASRKARLRPAPPPPPRVDSPLDAVNDAFHREYDGARSKAEHGTPVFVIAGDALVVLHCGRRRTVVVTPRLSHLLKSAAHAPVALFSALERLPGKALDRATRGRLEGLRRSVAASLGSLDDERDAADRATLRDLRALLATTLAFLERALEPRASGARTRARLGAFAKKTGPLLLRLTAHATRAQLDALDAGVAEALTTLTAAERRRLHVVVTGDHQARVRSLGMQYFKKRFGEAEGTDDRVAYAEGVTDVDEALALVGRRRLDVAIAKAFFGDARRLQRDVLGDAVHVLLKKRDLAPIR